MLCGLAMGGRCGGSHRGSGFVKKSKQYDIAKSEFAKEANRDSTIAPRHEWQKPMCMRHSGSNVYRIHV
jgi:hypothetical protein